MEGFMDGLGAVALVVLILIGAVAGWIAGKIAGQRMGLYIAVGIAAAVATPFVLAGIGLGAIAAGGLILLLLVGAIGAVIVLAIVRAVTGGR